MNSRANHGSYTHDTEGNVVTKTSLATGSQWTYAYDFHNRMTSAIETSSNGNVLTQASYTYDALNRRIGKNVNGNVTTFFYDSDNIWKQVAPNKSVIRYLTNGQTDGWLARSSSKGVNWYFN